MSRGGLQRQTEFGRAYCTLETRVAHGGSTGAKLAFSDGRPCRLLLKTGGSRACWRGRCRPQPTYAGSTLRPMLQEQSSCCGRGTHIPVGFSSLRRREASVTIINRWNPISAPERVGLRVGRNGKGTRSASVEIVLHATPRPSQPLVIVVASVTVTSHTNEGHRHDLQSLHPTDALCATFFHAQWRFKMYACREPLSPWAPTDTRSANGFRTHVAGKIGP